MKLLEWNIHGATAFPCNNGYKIPKWVVEEIIKQDAECVGLPEHAIFKVDVD